MKILSEYQIKMIKQKIAIAENKFIIRLNVAADKSITKTENNRNIYCVNNDYEVLWQIDVLDTAFEHDSFTSINLSENKLIAKRFSGFKYKVDVEIGRAEVISWDK